MAIGSVTRLKRNMSETGIDTKISLSRFYAFAGGLSGLSAIIILCVAVGASLATIEEDVQALIASGSYAEAEQLLHARIADPHAPVASGPAVQLEILRRTRSDFPMNEAEVLAQLQKSIPDARSADVAKWREAGDLQYRLIDGEFRYFRQAVPNLFRFNDEAKRRRLDDSAKKKFNLNSHIEQLVAYPKRPTIPNSIQ